MAIGDRSAVQYFFECRYFCDIGHLSGEECIYSESFRE
jgi:hypothetical protein